MKIHGKRSGDLPTAFEYTPDVIMSLRGIANVSDRREPLAQPDIVLPSRPPTLCAGCPHRGIFHAVRKAAGGKKVIYSSDIGCYSLGAQPPFLMADMILCMGGGIGAAGGFCEATDQKVIAFAGDSTFFHGGITPLVNALFNGHKFVTVILDNRATSMTGHQPHPGTGREYGGRSTEPLNIEDVVKGLGVKHVETVDPYDIQAATDAMKRAMDLDELSVVIAKRACPLDLKKKKMLEPKICAVNEDACRRCSICISSISCPALMKKDGRILIDKTQCTGCMMCGRVCPAGAIEVMK